MTRAVRPLALVVGGAVLALLAGACGVPSSDGPDRIRAADLPSALRDPLTSSTTTTTEAPTTTAPPTTPTTVTPTSLPPSTTTTTTTPVAVLTIWLVGPEGLLVPVTRTAPADAGPDEALALLDEGPTAAEQAVGIGSAFPVRGLFRLLEGPERGRAVVVLADPDFYTDVTDQNVAFGQIVRTLGDAPRGGVGYVNFVREGQESQPIDVVDGENRTIGTDAYPEDYDAIVSPSA